MRAFKSIICLILSLSLVQCSSTPTTLIPTFPKEKIEGQIQSKIILREIDVEKTRKDILRFRKILKTKKVLSSEDLALHDSLLEIYKQLKYRPREGVLLVPPRSKLTLPLNSYCLQGGKAEPSEEELFQWRKNNERFLYLNEVLRLSTQRKYPQHVLQNLLWALHNKTLWENYPEKEKNILKEMDPKAPIKLPSAVKNRVEEKIFSEIEKRVPEDLSHAASLVEGRYYDYETLKQLTENTKAKEPLPLPSLSSVEGTSLYVSNFSEGFHKQQVSFYNVTDKEQKINLNEYYQQPYRQSVQSIAAYFGLSPEEALFLDLEKLLYSDMIQAGFGFIPGVNDLIDLYEFSTGKNFFTDEWLTSEERFMSAMGLLAASGSIYRYADKIMHGPASYIDDVQKKYRQIKNTESYKELERLSRDAEKLKISNDWRVKVTQNKKRGNQGIEFISPDNEHHKVRVMPGKSESAYPNSQRDYVKVTKDGESYNKHGMTVKDQSDESHIPMDEIDISKFPWIKKEGE